MRIVTGIFSGIFSFVLAAALVALGIVITLNLTILNPDFAISELDKLDGYSIISDKVREQIPAEEPHMVPIVDETITELEPWLRDQTNIALYDIYAYLKGDQELNIVIPLEQVRTCVKENVEQAILESLPPEFEGASHSQIQALLSQAYAEVDKQIPQQIELNEASLDPEVTAQLQQARQIVGYIELGYKLLIGLAILLILLIALIQWWHIKPIALYVGIPMAIAGAVTLVGSLVAGSLIYGVIHGVPPDIMSILPQLLTDCSRPLQIYGTALLVAGIGLIVLSVRLKPSGYAS